MNALPPRLCPLSVLLVSFVLFLLLSPSVSLPSSASLSVFSREDVALLYKRLKPTEEKEKQKKNDEPKRWTTEKTTEMRTTTEGEAAIGRRSSSSGRSSKRTTPAGTRARHRWRSRQQQNVTIKITTRAEAEAPHSSTTPSSSYSIVPTWSKSFSAPRSTTTLVSPVPPQRPMPFPAADGAKRVKDQRIAFVATPISQKASPSTTHILWLILIILIGVFFTVATTIGNALVMISICVDKKLQTISNYFLFSLAVADLTVGVISIPLMTLYTVAQSWDFGYALCQFWLCIDYLMCNASALNLLLISFDRYFSVTRPLTYRPKRTTRKALLMIAASYLLSLLLWPPWIVLWPYLEGRFIVEESAVCVVQFLALGNSRNWLSQLVTVATAVAAFYIPVTLMIVLYYKVYLETKRRRKELRKLQDGQIRGLHSAPQLSSTDLSLPPPPYKTSLGHPPPLSPSPMPITAKSSKSGLNFFELVNNLSPAQSNFRKKERFSLFAFCTGRAQTDLSSEDSLADECGAGEETSCGGGPGGGMTVSNLDSFLADSTTPIEMAQNVREGATAKLMDGDDAFVGGETVEEEGGERRTTKRLNRDTLELDRTSRPSSVHTYNSIVIIEYSDNQSEQQQLQRPSVRLSSHEEVASISAHNSVQRRALPAAAKGTEGKKRGEREEGREEQPQEDKHGRTMSREERSRLTKTKSCPAEGGGAKEGGASTAEAAGGTQQNGTMAGTTGTKQLMKNSDIIQLREEQMRRSEKERRRNERKQEGKAAKTLSAILFAFIITWTPYNVIVCLEAFFPNSVPSYLFTLSYFLSYVNSTINPLCYALCNARFRMTYLRIIKCKWRRSSVSRQMFAENAFGRSNSGRKVLLKKHSRARAIASSIQ